MGLERLIVKPSERYKDTVFLYLPLNISPNNINEKLIEYLRDKLGNTNYRTYERKYIDDEGKPQYQGKKITTAVFHSGDIMNDRNKILIARSAKDVYIIDKERAVRGNAMRMMVFEKRDYYILRCFSNNLQRL